jgi:RHS repeat-associated protein
MKRYRLLPLLVVVLAGAFVVSCGGGGGGGDQGNTPPVSDAGIGQPALVGEEVILDGSASWDADGDALTYSWSFSSMPPASATFLDDPQSVTPSFLVDVPGTYNLELRVHDGEVEGLPDALVISTDNSLPRADAGLDQSVYQGDLVTLDGSGSVDLDGDSLTYQWSFTSVIPPGSAAALSDSTSITPAFLVDEPGDYIAQLTVSDGKATSSPDYVLVSTDNTPPVADAGDDQLASVSQTVYLDGSGSFDVDGDLLTYRWSFPAIPSGSTAVFSDSAVVQPSFAVDRSGKYVAQLIVEDGVEMSLPDTVVVDTDNCWPVADAGDDLSVTRGQTVFLDGSGSEDADGDSLSYRWSLIRKPYQSTSVLSNPTSVSPDLVIDEDGSYIVQLIVSDGKVISRPDTVVVTTGNSRPVAFAGLNGQGPAGVEVVLDGSGSHDPDGDPLTYRWSFASVPSGSSAILLNPTEVDPSFVPDAAGVYLIRLMVHDGSLSSFPDTVMITCSAPVNRAPVAMNDDYSVDEDVTLIHLSGTGVLANDDDPDGNPMTSHLLTDVAHGTLTLNADGSFSYSPTRDFFGVDGFTYYASDGTDDSSAADVTVEVLPVNDPPTAVAGSTQTVAEGDTVYLDGSGSSDVENDPITYHWSFTSLPSGSAAALSDSTAPDPTFVADLAGSYSVRLMVHDGSLDSEPDSVSISAQASGTLPPDPADVAPELDPTVATDLFGATQFLYTGSSPIQTGMVPGTISTLRAAVLRGKALQRDGSPASGVRVTVLGRPEYGQTLTRADGMFDLAVNGGTSLTVNYDKAGFLSVQRQVQVPLRDYVWAPDVVITPLDPNVTAVDLTQVADDFILARGSEISDADGSRQATLLFPKGISAEMVMANGSTQTLTNLSVRVTEYTVGDPGPEAMPAVLPPASAYTYCIDLTVDEALAAGAVDVRFDRPLYTYVEDFIGFPVGSAVPTGYYDRQKGQWVPSDNGRVIKILGITGGMADLDTDGDGSVDDATALALLDITDSERQELATLYSPGQQLWRVPITHFTPWDCNWPFGPPDDARDPRLPDKLKPEDDPCLTFDFSVVECQNQILGESVPISGTPFTLNYRSDRVKGFRTNYSIRVPLADDPIPSSLLRILLEIDVAGRRFSESLLPGASPDYTFDWDGIDAYGRVVQGQVPVTVKISYLYQPVYYPVEADFYRSFAQFSPSTEIVPSRSDSIIRLSRTWRGHIGSIDSLTTGFGAWSLDVHHQYDFSGKILHRGDGTRRSAGAVGSSIAQVAGLPPFYSGERCLSADDDGCPDATRFDLYNVRDVARGPDGLFILDDAGLVYHLEESGLIRKVYGSWEGLGMFGSGPGKFDLYLLGKPGIEVGPDGSIYGIASGNILIRCGPDGRVQAVAGGSYELLDGGSVSVVSGTVKPLNGEVYPASEVQLSLDITSVVVGEDGSVFLYDSSESSFGHISQVAPDGYYRVIAGCTQETYWNNPSICTDEFGGYLPLVDGQPAVNRSLNTSGGVGKLALGHDGSLYFSNRYSGGSFGTWKILQLGLDGIVSTVAGGGQAYPPAGSSAADIKLVYPRDMKVRSDGGLLIADSHEDIDPNVGWLSGRVLLVDAEGLVSTIAGTGRVSVSIEGPDDAYLDGEDLPLNVWLHGTYSYGQQLNLTLKGDGGYFLTQPQGVFEVAKALQGFSGTEFIIPSADGQEAYVFAASGKHLRTLDTLTGTVLYEFTYDGDGLLASVSDRYGNNTVVERNAVGDPTAIIGPYGHRTDLALDANGYLSGMTNPASEQDLFVYTGDGLLTGSTDPTGNSSSYTYDGTGRLIQYEDPLGGGQVLDRVDLPTGFEVRKTTTMGSTTVYRVERLANGDQVLTNVDPGGATSQVTVRQDGSRTIVSPDGMVKTVTVAPDPRFGVLSPYTDSVTIQTPGGSSYTVTIDRTAVLLYPDDPFSHQSLTETTTASGRVQTRTFDAATRMWTVVTPTGRQRTAYVDAEGRPAQSQVAAGLDPVTYVYDAGGRPTELHQGTWGLWYEYDPGGSVAVARNAEGEETHYGYDAAGRVTSTVSPGGNAVGMAYDPRGNIVEVVAPSMAAHRMSYSAADQLTGYAAPGAQALVKTYDLDRRRTQTTLPSGRVQSFSYGGGRISGISYPEAAVSFAYLGSTDSLAEISWTPAAGQYQSILYSYDGSVPAAIQFAGATQGTFSYSYTGDLILSGISLDGGSEIAVQRDDDGLVTGYGPFTIDRGGPGGLPVSLTDGVLRTDYIFDSSGRLTGKTFDVLGTQLYDLQLVYDSAGRITQRVEVVEVPPSVTYDYTYDADGQLTAVLANGSPMETYGYDVNGNLTGIGSDTATYDIQDRLIGLGGIGYTFDADGFMVAKGSDTFTYSTRQELLTASLAVGETVSYAYDGFGRLTARTDTDGPTQYLYGDPDNLFVLTATRAPDGTVTYYYYDSAGRVVGISRTGALYYIASDQVGSPRLVIDSTGTVVKRLDFTSFGRMIVDTNPGFDLAIGFAGGIADPDTGLVRFGFRDYDPHSGRWTTRDPILFSGGQVNLYVYAGNNPIGQRDPTGLMCVGGEAYNRYGGGVQVCYDHKGDWSVCGEVGFGRGLGISVTPFGRAAGAGDADYLTAEFGCDVGPLGLGGALKLDDSGCLTFSKKCSLGPVTCEGGVSGKPDDLMKSWLNSFYEKIKSKCAGKFAGGVCVGSQIL